MQGLQVKLVVRLDRNEAHVLPVDSFGDRFRIEEVVLLDFTKGFTNWAGISFTSWPCSRKVRRRKCAPEQASIPIKQVCRFAVKAINCLWVNFFFNSTLPLSPRATR